MRSGEGDCRDNPGRRSGRAQALSNYGQCMMVVGDRPRGEAAPDDPTPVRMTKSSN